MTEDQLIELQGRQKAVGDAGEVFVLEYERRRLGRHPRVGDIRIVGRRDVGLGYDILSLIGETSTEPDPAPALDIMQVLRTFNDKVTRTSGTPIYLQGRELMRYLLGGTPLGYTSSQTRVYTNEGKPWTKDASMKLNALYLTGTDIATLAHAFKRTAAEIRTKLTEMGLTNPSTP